MTGFLAVLLALVTFLLLALIVGYVVLFPLALAVWAARSRNPRSRD